MRTRLGVGALVALLFLTVGCSRDDRRSIHYEMGPRQVPAAAAAQSITVTAIGTASGTPGSVTFSMGVEVFAATTAQALESASSAASELTTYLLDAGVAAENIQTTNLSVYPTYDYGPDGKQSVITGYQATTTLSVLVDDIELAVNVIDGAAAAVGDSLRIYGLSLALTDRSGVLAEARADAVEQARTQAGQLADAAGLTLGEVVSITEGAGDVSYPFPGVSEGGDRSISPGTQVLQVSVTVVFSVSG